MTRKNFCLYPFTAFSVDNSGKPRICCNNNAWDRVRLNKPLADPTFELLEAFNNPLHKEIRKIMIEDGRHPSCKKCWDIEDQGEQSWRGNFTESFKLQDRDEEYWISKCSEDGTIHDLDLLYLDITFGNKCNLKCVMCSEHNSTLILKEKLEQKEIPIGWYNQLIELDWFKDSSQFEKIFQHVKGVQRIHIVGGEPLIIEHKEFLQKFIDMGIAENIILSYNSNLTTLPRDIVECWKSFKQIYLCVSVDGYKELNEFIRFPMKWSKLEANLKEVNELATNHNNISIQIHATFSSLNYLYFTDLLNWIRDTSKELKCIETLPLINYVFYPPYFDPMHIQQELKEQGQRIYLDWLSKNQEYVKSFNGDTSRIDVLTSYYNKAVQSTRNQALFGQCLDKIAYFERIRGYEYPGPNLVDNWLK